MSSKHESSADELKEIIARGPGRVDPGVEIAFLKQSLAKAESEIEGLKGEVAALQGGLGGLKRKTRALTPNRLYGVVLVAAVAFTALLVYLGWAQTPSVSIAYNVGDIIGGILVGLAALFASIAYARRGE